MTREEYIDAVGVIIAHDKILGKVRDASLQLAKDVGDDFGGMAIIPETPLRQAFIEMLEEAANDVDKMTTYLIDEALRNGGSVRFKDGTLFPVTNADECWTVICALNEAAT